MYQNEPLTKEDAKELQELTLHEKVSLTQWEKMYQWTSFWRGQVRLSFSGGKDSTVMCYLFCELLAQARDLCQTVHIAFSNTELEYPEIRIFAKWFATQWLPKRFPSLDIRFYSICPKIGFRESILKSGYPIVSKEVASSIYEARRNPNGAGAIRLRGEYRRRDGTKSEFNLEKWAFLMRAPFQIGAGCCKDIKKAPLDRFGRETSLKSMVATMAEESRRRMSAWLQTGCNVFEGKRPVGKPMSFWRNQDVLAFIKERGIPICSVYGEIVATDGENDYDETLIPCKLRCTGCDRTGCVLCAFGAHLGQGENRFQRLKRTHPHMWRHGMFGGEFNAEGMWVPNEKGIGMARVLDYYGVPWE